MAGPFHAHSAIFFPRVARATMGGVEAPLSAAPDPGTEQSRSPESRTPLTIEQRRKAGWMSLDFHPYRGEYTALDIKSQPKLPPATSVTVPAS